MHKTSTKVQQKFQQKFNKNSLHNSCTLKLVYSGIMLATLFIGIFKALSFTRITLGASTSLHNQVFKAVFRSPMYFFDTTPSGRILNRWNSQVDEVNVN